MEDARRFLKDSFFGVSIHNHFRSSPSDLEKLVKNGRNFVADVYSLPEIKEDRVFSYYQKSYHLSHWNSSYQLLILPPYGNPDHPTIYLLPDKVQKGTFRRETIDWGTNAPVNEGDTYLFGSKTETMKVEFSDGIGMISPDKPQIASMFVASNTPWKLKTGEIMYSLHLFEFADMALIETNFVVALPPDLQSKLFFGGNKISNYLGFANGKPVPSRLLFDHFAIWREYFKAFTEISESPNEKGDVITVTLRLKMNAFCKYAKATNDLTAK